MMKLYLHFFTQKWLIEPIGHTQSLKTGHIIASEDGLDPLFSGNAEGIWRKSRGEENTKESRRGALLLLFNGLH